MLVSVNQIFGMKFIQNFMEALKALMGKIRSVSQPLGRGVGEENIRPVIPLQLPLQLLDASSVYR